MLALPAICPTDYVYQSGSNSAYSRCFYGPERGQSHDHEELTACIFGEVIRDSHLLDFVETSEVERTTCRKTPTNDLHQEKFSQ